MIQLSALDSAFIYLESKRMPMHMGLILIYDASTAPGGKPELNDLVQFMGERVHMVKSFQRKLAKSSLDVERPYWVNDENFDVVNHIYHQELPKPGNWRQFCDEISRLHSIRLDRKLPLWEMHLIDGLDSVEGIPAGSFGIYLKVHHSTLDGRSMLEMIKTLHTKNPTPKPESQETEAQKPKLKNVFLRGLNKTRTTPLKLSSYALKFLPKLPKLIANELSGETDILSLLNRPPKTRFKRTVSKHRVFDSQRFDLAEIKAIGKLADGATINDVVLAICGGALRKYLEAKQDLPEESLIAMVPIDVSSEKGGDSGNQVSFMNVALGTEIADPLERLHSVRISADESKATTDAIGARQLPKLADNLPAVVQSFATRVILAADLGAEIMPWNTVVSNVPGPRAPIYMNGAKLLRFMGTGPSLDGLSIGFPVLSYNGAIEISMIGCRETVPDPEFVIDCVRESFDELKACTLGVAEPVTPKKRKAPARKTTAPKSAAKKTKP